MRSMEAEPGMDELIDCHRIHIRGKQLMASAVMDEFKNAILCSLRRCLSRAASRDRFLSDSICI